MHQKKAAEIAQAYDLSLRYSYAYLFKSGSNPNQHTFDLRQMQVRTFYNYALSRLIHYRYQSTAANTLPTDFKVGEKHYNIDLSHYPELKNMPIQHLQSSYVLNFSGFDKVNRQDGLGAEFVMVRQAPPVVANDFILDPMATYTKNNNPRIHHPRYLSVTATAQPVDTNASAEQIISGAAPFQLSLYNPYRYKTTNLNTQEYTLTANYTAPFAFWLAQNQLGKSGYLSLLDKVETLRMPHVYMLEPYQPNKKVIVLIHV